MMPFLVGSLIAIVIYALVIWTEFEAYISVTVITINLVFGCCLGCLQNTIIGIIITSYILGGIDFYIIFYALQNQVNPISLLLFWADLWTILFNIYTNIENYRVGEIEESEAEFDLENFTS
ncbi:hypothetical protein Glove_242g68 [Diversispora epigaea]|uniref:Uncharacterized protein n=1 Tax=Diversispora epigaea TaxID=1348612 RepID=A0A397IC62_9GLOM|nr:hypothetical protein Glove_242g68 [Diversispora epigaea]